MPRQDVNETADRPALASAGIVGLDDVLNGGRSRGGCHGLVSPFEQQVEAGFLIGEALRDFRGVLTGVPVYEGSKEPLLGSEQPR